jgi:hypothetical protein
MTTEKKSDGNANPPVVTAIPALGDTEEERQAGPGEVVVVSPTGTRSVVSEDRADSLKSQGYRVG